VRLPPGHGLGCDPDPEILARYTKGAPNRQEWKA